MTVEELVAAVRLAMGNIPPSILPDEVITAYVEAYLLQYPDSDCQVLYHSIVSCYTWLIANSAAGASGGGKRKEVNNKRSIEVDDYNKSSDWQTAMDNFISNPGLLLPQCAVEFNSNQGMGVVIVGGVREDRIRDINDDPNQRNGGASERGGIKPCYNNNRRSTGVYGGFRTNGRGRGCY